MAAPRRSLALLLLPLLALLPACRAEPDSALYRRALAEAGSFEEARGLCLRIRDPATRGDCRVAVVEAWDRLEPAECVAIANGPPELALWRDECMFQLAERLRRKGDLDAALAACLDTRFSRQCAWHLVQDEAEASLDEAPATAEARIARFAGARRLPDAALQFWTIRMRTGASRGQPVDEATCAALSDPTPCHEALRRTVRLALDARLRADRDRACRHAPPEGTTVDSSGAWVSGPLVDSIAAQWRSERCGGDAPPPPPPP